jgi:hypothetical protein
MLTDGLRRDQVEILSIRHSQRFDQLDRETKQVVGALLDDIRKNISDDIRQQTEALAQMFSRRVLVIQDESHVDQRMIVDVDLVGPEIREYYTYRKMREKERRDRRLTSENILNSLHFAAETERLQGVCEAHRQTFEWVYQPAKDQEIHWDSFVHWLKFGDGLYWINGKAGSGKSTLMKYISSNTLTRKYLSNWAGNSKLCAAEFYFWNLGTALQKSQVGLLRSLLHTTLRENPDLIPVAFPRQWAEIYSRRSLNPDAGIGFLPVC